MNFNEFEKILEEKFPSVDGIQKERFRSLEQLYREWNEKINVISRKDIGFLYLHHVLHSLAIAGFLKSQLPETFSAWEGKGIQEADGSFRPVKVLDLGTGGGFPGIPLAILFPNVQFTLCDSIGKKITVAKGVAGSLGLGNTEAVNSRAETLTGKYDFIVSRAVTSLDRFMPWVKGKYSQGILYLKGGDVVEEIAETMGKFRLPKGSVHVWPISGWLKEEYFNEKLVILIENNLQLR